MSMERIVVVCQVRTGSRRLPHKVLLPLAGRPLVVRFLERVSRCRLASDIVVATTTDPEDDVIEELCTHEGYEVYRGHPTDLLDRHYQVGRMKGADAIVKVPSDCPLIDPDVIDAVIACYRSSNGMLDYVSNLHPPTWPDGNDVEVMRMGALENAWQRANRPFEREHTTPWFWNENPDIRLENVVLPSGLDLSAQHRWTIDYPEDYILLKAVFDDLYHVQPRFTTNDVLAYLDAHPEVRAVNAHLRGVCWYGDHLAELPTIDPKTVRLPLLPRPDQPWNTAS